MQIVKLLCCVAHDMGGARTFGVEDVKGYSLETEVMKSNTSSSESSISVRMFMGVNLKIVQEYLDSLNKAILRRKGNIIRYLFHGELVNEKKQLIGEGFGKKVFMDFYSNMNHINGFNMR